MGKKLQGVRMGFVSIAGDFLLKFLSSCFQGSRELESFKVSDR